MYNQCIRTLLYMRVFSLFIDEYILLVHRDLKLENILLQNAGPTSDLKIADFGLSALVRLDEDGYDAEESGKRKKYKLLKDVLNDSLTFSYATAINLTSFLYYVLFLFTLFTFINTFLI